MPSVNMGRGVDRKQWLDTLDCSKPDKFLREIFEFLKERVSMMESQVQTRSKKADKLSFSQLSFHKKANFSTMSGNDALILINCLSTRRNQFAATLVRPALPYRAAQVLLGCQRSVCATCEQA